MSFGFVIVYLNLHRNVIFMEIFQQLGVRCMIIPLKAQQNFLNNRYGSINYA